MDTKYIGTDSITFKAFIDSKGDKAELRNIDGHNRWVIKEGGVEYIVRPEECKV